MAVSTHAVTNQVSPLQDYNLLATDAALSEALQRDASGTQVDALAGYGSLLGSEEVIRLGEDAERHPPELETHDRIGQRIDTVRFHPAWHGLMRMLREQGLAALPYSHPGRGAWSAYAAGIYLHGQVDAGSLCPTTMTMASVSVLTQEPELFESLRDKLYSTEYDPRDVPIPDKKSILVGMGMTEKQGGSDLRANSTQAHPLGAEGRGQAYELVGHKWFFSAPMCDAHLVLARTASGPSCFFVPRWRPDGTRNAIHIQRLKDKVGNRSNSSSEVEFDRAWGLMVGEEGRGIPTIIGMATFSRLTCVIGSSALMRQAVVQSLHYARHRMAFGRALADQPLMRSVLADMALESEAATTLMMRLARAFEHADQPGEQQWCRIMMPAAKFWVCKRAVELTGEAMEVWGGNGYVETGPMARLFREAPVNSIWEGSGNVICLDVLRAIGRDPLGGRELISALQDKCAGSPALQAAARNILACLELPQERLEAGARRFVQQLVLLAQAVLLLEHAPAFVSEAFIASRFDSGGGRVYGMLPPECDVEAILQRAWASSVA
jgi:putative acyl-CoA dehydrogenase